MKNIFVAILFLSSAIGFGQKKTVVKKEQVKKATETLVVVKSSDKDNLNEVESIGYANKVESDTEISDYSQIFTAVQVQASPPGGINAYRKQIASSLKFPDVDKTTTGTVITKFVVWDDGSIRDIKILKENPADLGAGQQVLKLLTNSKKWTPGQMNGKNVKQYYTLPISFLIEGSEKRTETSDELKEIEDSNTVKEKASDDTDYTQIFNAVTEPAEPPGGMNAFRQYIGSNFKLPVVHQTTMGTVVARFVVWDDGSIQNIQIVKETPENLGLGKEAIRLLSGSDKWKPGQYNGRVVKQYFTLPITIQIKPEEKTQPIKN